MVRSKAILATKTELRFTLIISRMSLTKKKKIGLSLKPSTEVGSSCGVTAITRRKKIKLPSNSWKDLSFWKSGEYQVIEENIADLQRSKTVVNPTCDRLFEALQQTSLENTKVIICGQDPYPDPNLATGLAFSIPPEIEKLPPTLSMIFDEYETDLGLPRPATGSLQKWAENGVLLWNVIPSCTSGQSLSHDWEEWKYLNVEIFDRLSTRKVVFVLLGTKAREYSKLVPPWLTCIEASHPSPRGNKFSNTPFIGSRIFTRTNEALVPLGETPIDWRL